MQLKYLYKAANEFLNKIKCLLIIIKYQMLIIIFLVNCKYKAEVFLSI
jgi:hypothetical protein